MLFTSAIFKYVIIAVVCYFIGNISPAIIVGKINGIDIRKEGSGNAGTTNVMRVLGAKWGLATLTVDILKGSVSAFIGMSLEPNYGILLALVSVLLGHCFPALYDFKGGKGVATTFGAALVLSWQSALIALAVAIFMLILFKRMSLSSILAVTTYPLWFYLLIDAGDELRMQYTGVIILIALFIIFMHRENIKRLIKGEEPKLSFGKAKAKDKK